MCDRVAHFILNSRPDTMYTIAELVEKLRIPEPIVCKTITILVACRAFEKCMSFPIGCIYTSPKYGVELYINEDNLDPRVTATTHRILNLLLENTQSVPISTSGYDVLNVMHQLGFISPINSTHAFNIHICKRN